MGSELGEVLAWLEARVDPDARAQMGPRYGIHVDRALGEPMRGMKALAKDLGRSHELAAALWASGGYEARTVAALVDEPAQVTVEQMDAWAGDDREFVRRGAFALVWALALHDRTATDAQFSEALALLEAGAADERPLVGKAVIMAMRAIGKKHPSMVSEARATAERLAAAASATERRAGRAVLKELPG